MNILRLLQHSASSLDLVLSHVSVQLESSISVTTICPHARRQHGLPTHVAFIDLVKAYDTASHELLLQVLEKYGAPPKLIDVVRRLYTDLKVVLKIGKLKTEILQGVGVRQGNNMAGVLFLFLMNAFSDLMELKFARAGISRPEMMRESDESIYKGQFIRHVIDKCRKSPTMISFIVDLAIYVDDTAVAFPSREQLEKGICIIQVSLHHGDADAHWRENEQNNMG